MAQTRQIEDRLLTADERDLVAGSRYPAISELSDADLANLVKVLRDRRDRARDISSRQRREMRGKAQPSGTRPAADNAGSKEKLAVLAAAVQRLNKESTRRRQHAARGDLVENAQKALAMRQKAQTKKRARSGRPGTRTADKGMRKVENEKAPDLVNRMEVGRVSQFVKNSQAKRDAR